MNFEADFAPMKLRSAYGEPVCKVLDFLCDKALEASGFTFEAPIYPTEQYYEDAVAAEGAEVGIYRLCTVIFEIQYWLLDSICRLRWTT